MRLSSSIAGVVLILSAACGGPMAKTAQPPGAILVIPGERVTGVEGSYVWGGRAADRMLALPAQAIIVGAGDRLRFEGEGGVPQEAVLFVYRADDVSSAGAAPVRQDTLDPATLAWTVALEPGDYVLSLFRAWDDRGDVTHHFRVRVPQRLP
jgi:hypothetical protein